MEFREHFEMWLRVPDGTSRPFAFFEQHEKTHPWPGCWPESPFTICGQKVRGAAERFLGSIVEVIPEQRADLRLEFDRGKRGHSAYQADGSILPVRRGLNTFRFDDNLNAMSVARIVRLAASLGLMVALGPLSAVAEVAPRRRPAPPVSSPSVKTHESPSNRAPAKKSAEAGRPMLVSESLPLRSNQRVPLQATPTGPAPASLHDDTPPARAAQALARPRSAFDTLHRPPHRAHAPPTT